MPFYYAEVFVTINEDPCTIFDRQELLAINLNDDRQGMISPITLRILSVIVLTKSRPTADIDSKLISLQTFRTFSQIWLASATSVSELPLYSLTSVGAP